MKLQDAYVAEAAAVGEFAKIGYSMKDGDSFIYTDAFTGADKNTTMVEQVTSLTDAWTATSRVKLNDCKNAAVWKLQVKSASNTAEGMIEYEANIENQKCADLTPSFGKLSTDGTPTIGAGT